MDTKKLIENLEKLSGKKVVLKEDIKNFIVDTTVPEHFGDELNFEETGLKAIESDFDFDRWMQFGPYTELEALEVVNKFKQMVNEFKQANPEEDISKVLINIIGKKNTLKEDVTIDNLKGMNRKAFLQELSNNYIFKDENVADKVNKESLELLKVIGNGMNREMYWTDGTNIYRDAFNQDNGPGDTLQLMQKKPSDKELMADYFGRVKNSYSRRVRH